MSFNNIQLRKVDIKLDDKFSKLDGIRILHISDLHLTGKNEKIERDFNSLRKIKSDFIMVTGDLIDNNNGIGWCIKYLNKLSARFGTWAVFGNHDRYILNILHSFFFHIVGMPKKNNWKLLKQRLAENDIQVLINEKKTMNINSVPLTIVGVDAPFGFDRLGNIKGFSEELRHIKGLFKDISEDEYSILLNHVPDLAAKLGRVKIDLALSGHTHGGQIRLPLIGPLISFSSFQRKYSKGLYTYNGYYLNVSGGLGVSKTTPIRIFCPPEATILTLRKKD